MKKARNTGKQADTNRTNERTTGRTDGRPGNIRVTWTKEHLQQGDEQARAGLAKNAYNLGTDWYTSKTGTEIRGKRIGRNRKGSRKTGLESLFGHTVLHAILIVPHVYSSLTRWPGGIPCNSQERSPLWDDSVGRIGWPGSGHHGKRANYARGWASI